MATFDGETLKRIMVQEKLTLSVAESLTTGNIQAMIGATSGSSEFYRGGLTAYKINQKVKHLNVDFDHAEEVNCVSERVAREMAKGVSLSFNTSIGIGTTGYAEKPDQGKTSISIPHAYFAIWKRDGDSSEGKVVAQGLVKGEEEGLTRVGMQQLVAVVALNALLDYLKKDQEFA